jgi:chromosomal replication initiator protein
MLAAADAQQNLADVLELFERLNLVVCDDLQDLEGRTDRQELLLELIDGLRQNATHILMTSRKLPGELRDFSPRWVSRCHGGLCAALPGLGRESRVEFISRFVQVRHLPFIEPVGPSIGWLADRWTVPPAQIVMLLDRLAVSCQRRSAVIDIPYLERWLAEETPAEILSLDAIVAVVASEFGIAPEELRSRSRQPGLIVPRQCAMFLAREFTGRPLEFIGQYFGDRTHTTVSHSLSRLKALLPNAPTLRQQVQRLRKRLAESRREDCA